MEHDAGSEGFSGKNRKGERPYVSLQKLLAGRTSSTPLLVRQTFDILKDLRARGISVLMIEQNARSALEISDYGLVLELGRTRVFDRADKVLADPRIVHLFLGGAIEGEPALA